MSKHGGKRIGSGRKSKAQEQQLIEKLDNIINEEDVIKELGHLIAKGDLRAIQLYLNYRRGRPKETLDVNSSEGFNIDFKELIGAVKSQDKS